MFPCYATIPCTESFANAQEPSSPQTLRPSTCAIAVRHRRRRTSSTLPWPRTVPLLKERSSRRHSPCLPPASRTWLSHFLKQWAMGRAGSIQRTSATGDAGIDGVINQDPLGLDRIYMQAKRYATDRTVDRPKIHEFAGALLGKQGDRGVFITTSRFSPGAINEAERINARRVDRWREVGGAPHQTPSGRPDRPHRRPLPPGRGLLRQIVISDVRTRAGDISAAPGITLTDSWTTR